MFRFVIFILTSLVFVHQAKGDGNDFLNVPRTEDVEILEDEYIGYRLPNDTRPEAYEVRLRTWVNEERFDFEGQVNISIITVNETNAITLHHRELNIVQIRLFATLLPTPVLVSISLWTYNSTFEFLRIPINSVLPANVRYLLEITYTGTLRTDEGGFYRSSYYNDAGEIIWLASTQFELTNARHGFPCYDEPALKANFTLHMTHDPSYSTISNMPQSNLVVNDDGSLTTSFLPTPPTPTYLIAFIVSDFEYTESSDPNRVVHQRAFSRPNAVHLTELALEAGEGILDGLEEYIGVDLSLLKMDQAGIPHSAGGGVVGALGLAIYREPYFLFDVNTSMYTTKTSIVTYVGHEYAHGWFGNLVTPRWWTYIWLNEGFATLLEVIGTDLVYADWQIMDFFVVRYLQRGLQDDASLTARPLTYYVESSQDISQLFGTYSSLLFEKSTSVLRMWLHAFSESTFLKGVKYFLNARAYNDAADEDLFEGLERAIREDNVLDPHFDVFEMLHSWTRQGGFPLLRVERNYTSGLVTFSQQRYLTTPIHNPPTTLYWIPISVAWASNANFSNTFPTVHMVLTQSQSITIQSLPEDEWLLVNMQQSGFYRVQYDERNYELIAEALRRNVSSIHVSSRAHLLDDLYNFARTNRGSFITALGMARFLEYDTSYVSWYPAIAMITEINNNFQGHENYPRFRNYVRTLIEELYEEVGILDIPHEAHIRKYARTIAINWACRMGSVHCQSDANRQLRRLINEGVEFHQNVRDVTYCAAMRSSSQSDFDFMLNRIFNTTDASRNALFTALGCTSSSRLLYYYIDLTLPITSEGRDMQFNTTADNQLVFNAVHQGSPEGHQIALNYFATHLDSIHAHFGSTITYNFLRSLAAGVGSVDGRAEVTVIASLAYSREYITANELNNVIEVVLTGADWHAAHGIAINDWLVENQY